MTDRLDAIKLRAEYASAGEPATGQEDLYWLIAEVDALRSQLVAVTRHVRKITSTYEQQVNSCSTGECGG